MATGEDTDVEPWAQGNPLADASGCDEDDLGPGEFVTVEVDEAGEYDLWGRLV